MAVSGTTKMTKTKTPLSVSTRSSSPHKSSSAPSPLYSRHWFMPRFCLSARAQYDNTALWRADHAMNQRKQNTPREAAVMIPLVEREGRLYVLFTKRAAHLEHHPGQISFPGGKVEKTDKNIIETAIREMKEEIGILISKENLLGCLPPLLTVSGYLVTPVVAFISPTQKPTLDHNEVAAFFEVPISKFIAPHPIPKHPFHLHGKTYYIYAISHQEHLIWGITAQILHTLMAQITPTYF